MGILKCQFIKSINRERKIAISNLDQNSIIGNEDS